MIGGNPREKHRQRRRRRPELRPGSRSPHPHLHPPHSLHHHSLQAHSLHPHSLHPHSLSVRPARRRSAGGPGGAVGPAHSGRSPAGSFPRASDDRPEEHSVGHPHRHRAGKRARPHAAALPGPVGNHRGCGGDPAAGAGRGRRIIPGSAAPRHTARRALPGSLTRVSASRLRDSGFDATRAARPRSSGFGPGFGSGSGGFRDPPARVPPPVLPPALPDPAGERAQRTRVGSRRSAVVGRCGTTPPGRRRRGKPAILAIGNDRRRTRARRAPSSAP